MTRSREKKPAAGLVVAEIPARAEFVSFVRDVIAAAAELEAGMDAERIADLKVAVSEATTNAISAHADVDSRSRIRVQCDLAVDEVAVVVHDKGLGFDPDALVPLPPSESPERLLHESGLGVPLMRILADESEIRSNSGGTEVRLVLYPSRRRQL